MFLTCTQRPTLLLGLLAMAACTPAPSDGFVPSESFFAASQNCDALQAVSDQHCGGETIPAYCFGKFVYEQPALAAFIVTEIPAYTCEDAVEIAIQLAADEDKVHCELIDSPSIEAGFCDPVDSGEAQWCGLHFICYRQ
jgi:hypothetical protein